jgi:hypothetical protein
LACDLDAGACRERHIAKLLQLKPKPGDAGNWIGHCPVCGHGGFALSQPTLTKMRNMWTCNCRICHGGKGCPVKDMRAAMLRRKIAPWCLGSYVGKGKPETDLDQLRKLAQTVDDLINCRPNLSAADMIMTLAEARGHKIPDDYRSCADFAKKELGMSNGNAYNVAAKWAKGSGSRPSDSEVPPQTGGGSQGLKSYHTEAEPCQTPRSEAQNLPKVGNGDSKSWKESTLDEAPEIPKLGKQTQDDNTNRRPAA